MSYFAKSLSFESYLNYFAKSLSFESLSFEGYCCLIEMTNFVNCSTRPLMKKSYLTNLTSFESYYFSNYLSFEKKNCSTSFSKNC